MKVLTSSHPAQKMKNPSDQNRKTIFFDVYQTLIDIDIQKESREINQAKAWEVLASYLEKYGAHVTGPELLALNDKQKEAFYVGKDIKIHHHDFSKLLTNILKNDFGVEVPMEQVREAIHEFHKIARGHMHLYPGVLETLPKLKERYSLSIVSYTQASWTQAALKELGIEQFFSHFIYTSDLGFHKESIGFYEKCLEIAGEQAENCMMIGDNYIADVLTPQKIGIKAIWIKNPLTADQYLDSFDQEPKNMIRLEDFDKLPAFLEEMGF
jgi:HAD superfamily hydrolase (TIGR01549 family)